MRFYGCKLLIFNFFFQYFSRICLNISSSRSKNSEKIPLNVISSALGLENNKNSLESLKRFFPLSKLLNLSLFVALKFSKMPNVHHLCLLSRNFFVFFWFNSHNKEFFKLFFFFSLIYLIPIADFIIFWLSNS